MHAPAAWKGAPVEKQTDVADIITMAFLEIIEGVNKGAAVRLKPENFIGRSSDNAIALSDTEVSRQHAVIRSQNGQDNLAERTQVK